MSEYHVLAVLAGFAFLYSAIASRLERTPISGAVIYLLVGFACGSDGFGIIELNIDRGGVKGLAELTLALVLFADAANADLSTLRRVKGVPIRLLLLALPLTIAAGVGVGWALFDELTLLEIALLATMLAPTDAALGQAVVTNESVPSSVRESLNIESGLNDGICVPVLLVFLSLASGQATGDEAAGLIVRLPLQAIGIGAIVGVALAFIGSPLLRWSGGKGWISDPWTQIPVVALALCCFAVAQSLGGSGFIASFVGGLVFGGLKRFETKEEVLRGAEAMGNVFSMLTWFTFGAIAIGIALQNSSWQVVVYAMLSLTAVRIVPVLLCLSGLRMHADSRLFLGWFGPRGLASIVFVVMVMDEKLPGNDLLAAVVTWTVTLSIVAHGISAVPLAKMYGQRVAARQGAV